MNREKVILATTFLALVLVFTANCSADAAQPPPPSLAWPGCPDACGHLTNIPYPFGIGHGCFLDPWYEIDCQQIQSISTPVLKKFGLVVSDVQLPKSSSSPGYIKVRQPISYSHPNRSTNQQTMPRNNFVAGGCDNQALMTISDTPGKVIGCKSSCGGDGTLGLNQCINGTGCCVTSIIDDIGIYSVEFQTFEGQTVSSNDAKCRFAFLVEHAWLNQADLSSLPPYVPVMLEWAITQYEEQLLSQQSNRLVNNNSGSCQKNVRPGLETILYCSCNPGYIGNYFLPHGCQDIDECKEDPNICRGKCVNLPGSSYCVDTKAIIITSTATGLGAIVLLLLSWWLYKFIKRRRVAKLKQKFFQRNGGLILQQRLSSIEDNHKAKGKLFASTELDIATDHFNKSRILGQGGQGTVYKGMLIDGTILAIKKSKVVIILFEINHRNVVRLLGFCLECEVPLLVYEFVPNGTLYQYLHDPCRGFPISWETQLRIANEIAGALSYLHFAAAIPIYHRDIKSSNILLDESYRAKVADFGTSISITIDQTHMTTKVHGTIGYLDPEFFRTSQFTDKSDVYSFGVVLVELLTREKPICELRAEEGRSLATYFIRLMEENCLFDILDKEVLDHGEKEEINDVSNLAKRCLNLKGRYRPTMKEVAMELERIRSLRNPVVVWQNDEEIDHIRARSIYPLSTVSTLMRSEADVELTLLEDDQSLFYDLPR
ncbi:hypothetical protein ACJRO7_021407 [Eucalyptus globulus]|uniref:Protein kinase domain-containing protein n=1 Tax=Eucalyptus globulus TaxID=34317 RepID=A0ABD3KL93_EUCGL